jgi:hypothetical protein
MTTLTGWISPEGEQTIIVNPMRTTHAEKAHEILTGRTVEDVVADYTEEDMDELDTPEELAAAAQSELLEMNWIRYVMNPGASFLEGRPEAVVSQWSLILDLLAKYGAQTVQIDLNDSDGQVVRSVTLDALTLKNEPPRSKLSLTESPRRSRIAEFRDFRRRPVQVRGHRRRA